MRANASDGLCAKAVPAAFVAALSVASMTASASRIFVPGDGIGTSGDAMGTAVALSGDTAAVGIPQGLMTPTAAPGVIAIYRNVAGAWQREAFLGPGLPSAFALQQDMLVVGGAHVTTFLRNGTIWTQEQATIDASASSIALSAGTLLISGSPATAYTRSSGAWTLQGNLAGDQPNEAIYGVALDGDVAAVLGVATQPTVQLAYVHFYHRSGDTWTLEYTVQAGGGLGVPTVPIAVSGQTVLVGFASEVDAYVRAQDGSWSLQGALDPLVAYAPGSVAIDGDRAVVGSPSDAVPGFLGAGTAYVFERSAGTWSRTDHFADPNPHYGEGFASSVALAEGTVVVGAPGAITAAGQAGYASVIDVGTSPSSYVATLDAGNAHAHERFGTSFGASASTLAVGAPQADVVDFAPAGAAYVFGLTPDGWSLEAELQGPASTLYGFGTAAAASTDTVVVGSPSDNQTGAAYVYMRGDGSWPEAARLAPDDSNVDSFGQAAVLDGNRIAVGAPRGAGKVYLYTGAGSSWPEEAVLVPSISTDGDYFGSSISLAGDTIVVGAPLEDDGIEIRAGLAFVFVNTGSGWAEQAVLELPVPIAQTGFGTSVALQGDTALVGTAYVSSGPQHVYVFHRTGTSWTLETTLDFDASATEDYVGSVAISPDESRIAIGMPTQFPGAGRVLTFLRDGGSWVPGQTYVDEGPGNPGGVDGFGAALAFSGESVFIGAPQDGAGGAVFQYGFGDAIFASGFDPVP